MSDSKAQPQPNTNNSDTLDDVLGGTRFTPGLGSRQTNDLGLSRAQFKEAKAAILNLIAQEANKARLDELIWSTGVEYKYERDNKIIQDRIAQLTAQLKAEKGTS